MGLAPCDWAWRLATGPGALRRRLAPVDYRLSPCECALHLSGTGHISATPTEITIDSHGLMNASAAPAAHSDVDILPLRSRPHARASRESDPCTEMSACASR